MSKFFQAKKGGIETTTTLSPQQQQLMGQLAPYLQERIGRGLPAYTGEFVAPPSELEEAGLGRIGEELRGEPGLYTTGVGALSDILERARTPEATIDWYRQYMMPEERRIMEEEVIPGVREAYVPGGTYWGSPRMEAEAGAWETYGGEQMGRIGQAILAAQQLGAQVAPTALQYAGYPTEAAMTYGALPRQIAQQDLTARLQEFIRTTPELSPVINQALQLLSEQTMTGFYRPYQKSPFMEILPELIEATGLLIAGSDIRLKENIRKIGKLVSGIGVYVWKWKKWARDIVKDTPTIGVIAQEAMKVIPEAVIVGEHGYLMVDYSKIW